MAAELKNFDAVHCQLTRGVHLVEASAGTGKTYAITMLVLRAVVELGVPIDRILIVTFTKAATEELRQRIRSRLVEARKLLFGEQTDFDCGDATLISWGETVVDRQLAVIRLQLALADMDKAGIFTIHGFCQRMLAEQSLESGQLFDVDLLTDVEQVRMQVAEDFWRSRIYPLAALPCGIVMHAFPTPESMLASVAETKRQGCRIEPRCCPLPEVLSRLTEVMAQLTAWWQGSSGELSGCFREGLAAGLFKKPLSDTFESWWAALDDFFAGRTFFPPENLPLLLRPRLAGELNGKKIKGEEGRLTYLQPWPLPAGEVEELLTAATDLVLTLRVELAEHLRAEVTRRLLDHGNIGFDDLITRLHQALQGERGAALRQLLGVRYAVVLIDEFQDTDAVQWHIFSSVFGTGNHCLYLIGDPKQAIYKFRGADIHSYFFARQTAGHLLTLEHNHRSHPSLVAEINRLFTSRPRPFFFPPEVLDFHPAIAAKSVDDADLQRDGASLAGMVYCLLNENPEDAGGRWSSGKASACFLPYVVAEIGRLLDPVNPLILRTGGERPLAPHDIAILVRSHSQAEAYRRAMAEAGIPAVVTSRASVLHSEECRHLVLLLQAIATPGDMGRLRSALTIPWFGLTGNELHALWQDTERLNLYHSRFLEYHQHWREQGVLPMMSRLLVVEEVLVTLAATRLAERTIANITHLFELAQGQESDNNLGMSQLVQWLLKMYSGDLGGSENSELLLESDEEAVRIITMHGAKGLEFPVVFCPFLWYRNNRVSSETQQISGYDEEHSLVVDLGSELFPARREQAIGELMAEDLRLLYVALTRAKIRCYTMWADVKSHSTVAASFDSALGYLLFPGGALPYQEQRAVFQGLAADNRLQLAVVSENEPRPDRLAVTVLPDLRPRIASGRSLHTDWQMSSYSAMAMLSDYQQEAAPLPSRSGTLVPVPGLPAGAGFGNLIHDLLDDLPFSAIAGGFEDDAMLCPKCQRYGIAADPREVGNLLQQIVTTPLLPVSGTDVFCLANVDPRRCLKEMGFYFHLGSMTTANINTLLADESTVVPLGPRAMRGYLTGFIDLLCEYDGKYYIIDYKTNYLGDFLDDYRYEQLRTAMQSHNYGLQYWIYSVVVHRHLRNFLPGYNFHNHFGGVMYLFVRGMTPKVPGSGVYFARPDYAKVLALNLAMGGTDDVA